MKIISVVGARPNFIKISHFIKEIKEYNKLYDSKINHMLIHTGQHYDDKMSESFFVTLNIPKPDINLGIGSGSHAEQVGNTMIEFEKVLVKQKPDWVVVLGDVNATLACSLTAKKLHIKVCHIEAGLRSRDRSMPEEINRIVTDRMSDLLLVPDRFSIGNLLDEGVDKSKIKFVGNIMIDTLMYNKARSEEINLEEIINNNKLQNIDYSHILNCNKHFDLITIHRPSNVDDKANLSKIINFLTDKIDENSFIIWPIHPRTMKQLENFNLIEKVFSNDKIIALGPVSYHEMLKLNIDSKLVLTDSGGIQEECTILNTPCITLRNSTERPVTLVKNGGVSVLVGNDMDSLQYHYNNFKNFKKSKKPEKWDGKTSKRCLEAILNFQ